MTTLKSEWEDYKNQCINPDSPQIQYTEMQRGFYGGAVSILNMLLTSIATKTGEEHIITDIENWVSECVAFGEDTMNTSKKITRKHIKADGTAHNHLQPLTIPAVHELLNCEYLDTVHLTRGKVMLVDDGGYAKGLPVNAEATRIYHACCGPDITHEIRGDVFIAPDADFAYPKHSELVPSS